MMHEGGESHEKKGTKGNKIKGKNSPYWDTT